MLFGSFFGCSSRITSSEHVCLHHHDRMSARVDDIASALEGLTVSAAEIDDTEPSEVLDELLKDYLDLIDEHQSLQVQLGSLFSSVATLHHDHIKNLEADIVQGFLSLSQANYASRSSVRYGQDYYDERMQSIVKL